MLKILEQSSSNFSYIAPGLLKIMENFKIPNCTKKKNNLRRIRLESSRKKYTEK